VRKKRKPRKKGPKKKGRVVLEDIREHNAHLSKEKGQKASRRYRHPRRTIHKGIPVRPALNRNTKASKGMTFDCPASRPGRGEKRGG